jgi:hypothetical protein
MTPLRLALLPAHGIPCLGGYGARPPIWIPLPLLYAALFPRPVVGPTPCECGHGIEEHRAGRNCAPRGCACLFYRPDRRMWRNAA